MEEYLNINAIDCLPAWLTFANYHGAKLWQLDLVHGRDEASLTMSQGRPGQPPHIARTWPATARESPCPSLGCVDKQFGR